MKKYTSVKRHLPKSALTLLLSSAFVFSSCLPQGAQDSQSELEFSQRDAPTRPNTPSAPSGNTPDDEKQSGIESLSSVGILNFNQMNMNFSKITGISRGDEAIQSVMSEILNQLPSGNDIDSFTAFTQISITRLAFSYCDEFIERDDDFSSVNYSSSDNEEIINLLLRKMLDTNNASNPSLVYEDLANELNSVLNNDTNDDAGTYIDEGNGTTAQRKKRLTKMACTLALSSSYVTMI